jgi:hypothetical protein
MHETGCNISPNVLLLVLYFFALSNHKNSMIAPLTDERIRLAAFDWLQEQTEIHGDLLPWGLITEDKHLATLPVNVIGDSVKDLNFTVAVDSMNHILQKTPDDAPERLYQRAYLAVTTLNSTNTSWASAQITPSKSAGTFWKRSMDPC